MPPKPKQQKRVKDRIATNSSVTDPQWRVELRLVQSALRRYYQGPDQNRGFIEWVFGPYRYRLSGIDIQRSVFICDRLCYADGTEIDWDANPSLSRTLEFRAMLGERWEEVRRHIGMEPSRLINSGEARFIEQQEGES